MPLGTLLNALFEVNLPEQGFQIGLDWLGQFARIIVEGVGIVGLGIIVFNLVLKAITLPFDIYQRVKMRKQNLVMQEMQPELEKLQKQYAGDKQAYNEKMLELQKKNGYSLLGACLPMIVSFIILIVAWQGFRAYSDYANLANFERMSVSYNAAVLTYAADGKDPLFQRDEGVPVQENGAYVFVYTEDGEEKTFSAAWANGETLPVGDTGMTYTMTEIGENTSKFVTVRQEGKFILYRYSLEESALHSEYLYDTAELETYLSSLETKSTEAQDALAAIEAYKADASEENANAMREKTGAFVVKIGGDAAAETFRAHPPKFLWIQNVWYPDVSYSHPIPSYKTFSDQFRSTQVTLSNGDKAAVSSVINESTYENLTSQLGAEKNAPNGYFILIVLSIGFMLLSQIIVMKSSKATNKYQTVDGQGATTQKIMLVIMPLMYAFFAFSYSAAFSIYMTMSSVVSIVVTLVSNAILGHVFNKKEEARLKEEHTRVLPWMKDGDQTKKKRK